MDGVELLLVVIAAIAVNSLAARRDLPAPLVLVIIGLAVSFVPGLPQLEIDPDLILSFVLPPLIYSTAINFSFINFVRNLWPILGLGVGLVVVTALVVGFAGEAIVPALTLPAALVLGAVVAPPDAVTATAIGGRLGLPKRVMTILTGESLVNDAAALTFFTIAVAAVTGTTAFIANPFLYFLYSAAIGSVVGLLLAFLTQLLRRRLADAGLETVLGLVLPFAAYLAAEELHASGVIAVVVAGFSMGYNADKSGFAARLQERDVWRSIDVLLEAFVFAYMGLQVKFVLADVTDEGKSLSRVLLSALLILVIVMAVRPAWVILNHARLVAMRWWWHRHLARDEEARQAVQRHRQSRQESRRGPKREPRILPLRQELVISWTGMRGVVTLAAAAGIPLVTPNGAGFPARADIQVTAVVVAVGTLVIQGLTLPFLIRRLDLSTEAEDEFDADQRQHAQQIARDAAGKAAEESFRQVTDGVDPQVLSRLAGSWQQAQEARQQLQSQWEDSDEGLSPETRDSISTAFQQLRLDMVGAQRKALTAERDAYRLDDDVYREMLEQLDYDEASTVNRGPGRLG